MTLANRTEPNARLIPRDLAAVLHIIETTRPVDARRTREIISAIRSLGKWLGLPLEQIPAEPLALRRHLHTLDHHRLGVSKRRLNNATSLINGALSAAGVKPANRSVADVLSANWRKVFEAIENRYHRSSLAPFARFCSAGGIEPDQVSDAVSVRYQGHLHKTALVKSPDSVHQTVCRTWNQARLTLPEVPLKELAVPKYADNYSFKLEAFPQPFRDDLESYLARLACHTPSDLLDEHAPLRPLAASSIRTKRYQIRVFASALVHQGIPIEAIISLAVLTRFENFKLGLKFILARPRQDSDNTRTAGAIAHTIRSIAKYFVIVPEIEIKPLDTITARLNRHEPGMTEKNRLRLSQFEDDAVLQGFIDFPIAEIDRLRRAGVSNRNEAVEISLLIALEILLHVPLRIGNLAGLLIGEGLLLPPRGCPGEAVIFVPRRRVKNRQALHYILTEEATALVVYYVDKVKPLIENAPTSFLFPNKTGSGKRSDTLSKQISRLVKIKLGIEFNPHLDRHLVAKLNVDERPGDYDGPRRLLGHRNSQTTYSAYEGLETKSATRLHAELIRSKRRYVPLAERPRAARRMRATAVMGAPYPPKRIRRGRT